VRFAETADGVAEPEGVGGLEVGEGQDALLGFGEGFEEVAAQDAREDAGGQWWGEELPCCMKVAGYFDEEIADGPFG